MELEANRVLMCAALALVSACSAGGAGSVVVIASGEEAAVSGWPFESDGETIGFVDGWSLDVTRVLVALEAFELRTREGDDAGVLTDAVVVDLSGGDPLVWEERGVPAQRWSDVRYRIAPPTDGARGVGGASAGDIAEMVAAGSALRLVGRATHATHGAVDVMLDLPLSVRNVGCVAQDGTDGLVVRAGTSVSAQLTIHLDHLFFDSLVSSDAAMRFEPWAAAAGDDAMVTFADLETQQVADLRGMGGGPLRDSEGELILYDAGSVMTGGTELSRFVLASARTVGHFQGEGHCDYE